MCGCVYVCARAHVYVCVCVNVFVINNYGFRVKRTSEMCYEETCRFKALGRILLAACDLI